MARTASLPQPIDARALVPPLLACLPVSFASSRPPPALLSLLSPILKQRLHIFTSTSSSSSHESWIRLLCWDAAKAERLKETVENANFEPHPSSGEIEVGELGSVTYKRFDFETLKGQVPLTEWSLTAAYLWCTGGEDGDSWKLAELLHYDSDLENDPSWKSSISEAEQAAQEPSTSQPDPVPRSSSTHLWVPGQEEGEDEDGYWAQYDQTPGRTPASRTPARKPSTMPAGPGSADADYYARYHDVQPAMDSYDPDEQLPGVGESTLHGDRISELLSPNHHPAEHKSGLGNGLLVQEEGDTFYVNHPVPSSPSSRGSETVAKLEETAERYSASEIAIKQHISTSVKSMYRLARGAGMARQEFEDMVQRELETLSIFDQDD